ncbi:hypothetical protein [Nocardiopsis potens]|uniref:hypothetical protein n=1 Tax=Nocardiopsis potens TaxID=1246458 RepID=UPI0012679813|nr:hypothetical protein [Nocardiopsis potens]
MRDGNILSLRTGPTATNGSPSKRSTEGGPGEQARQRRHPPRRRPGPRQVTAPGAAGAPGQGPFDHVLSTVAARRIPPAWMAQTRPGGPARRPTEQRLKPAATAKEWAGPGSSPGRGAPRGRGSSRQRRQAGGPAGRSGAAPRRAKAKTGSEGGNGRGGAGGGAARPRPPGALSPMPGSRRGRASPAHRGSTPITSTSE